MFNKDNFLKFLMPVLLITVAIVQIYNVYANDLTPWKGGGFGMFAFTDRMEHRKVEIDLYYSGEKFKVDFRNLTPNSRERNFIHTMPTSERVKKLHTKDSSKCFKLHDEHTMEVQLTSEECEPQYSEGTILKDLKEAAFKPDSAVVNVNRIKFDTNSGRVTHERIIRKD